MVGAFISVSVSPVSGFSQPSRRMLTTDWLTERLPAEAIAMMRWPGRGKMLSLRKVAMLSTPALVRVSANITRPSRTRMPQQEVMTFEALPAQRPYIPIPMANPQWFLNSGSAAPPARRGPGPRAPRRRRRNASPARALRSIHRARRRPARGVGGAKSIGRIESDPAELGHERFRPGVAGLLFARLVIAVEIAADIACRNTEAARGGDEDVGEVPTRAALGCKGLRGGDCRASGSA